MLVKRTSHERQVAGRPHFISNKIKGSRKAQSKLWFTVAERVLRNRMCQLKGIGFLRRWKCSKNDCGDGWSAPQMYSKMSEANAQWVNCTSKKLLSILEDYFGKLGSEDFERPVVARLSDLWLTRDISWLSLHFEKQASEWGMRWEVLCGLV